MENYNSKRFYWIKLKTDFFQREDIDFLMSQENGSDYVVLYLMLCSKSANNNGLLCNNVGEMIVKYDVDKITRDCIYFNRDTVCVALELYKKLGLVYEDNNGIMVISDCESMVGSETIWAKKKREYRIRQNEGQCNGLETDIVRQEIRDKSIEYRDKSIDISNKKENLKALEQCDGKYLLGCDIPDGNQMATNDCHSIGKVSLGEFSSIVSNETNIHCPFTKDVIDYLNLKTGSNYKHTTKATLRYINARYKEGFSLDDFKRVIDTKTKQWINDPKMKQYLRPETLFSTKFESYLNQQEVHTFQGLPDLKSSAPARMLTPEEIEEENNKHYDF